MNPSSFDSTINKTADKAHSLANQAGQKADDVLMGAKRLASDTAEKIEDGLDSLRHTVPTSFSRAAAKAEDYARVGIDRARQAGLTVKEQALRTSDSAVAYVKDEPVKAMMMAAAAGAVTAVIVSWMTRPSRGPHY